LKGIKEDFFSLHFSKYLSIRIYVKIIVATIKQRLSGS